MSETSSKKRKLSLPLIVAGGVSSLVLALGMSPTFSAFTASITNSANASAGTLAMTETSGGTTCTSAVGTCTDMNNYGGLTGMKPGDTTGIINISIANTGSLDASSFTLSTGSCSGELCKRLKVTMTQDGNPVATVAGVMASNLPATVSLNPVGHGKDTKITIKVDFSSTGDDNAFQGTTASQALTWTFQS